MSEDPIGFGGGDFNFYVYCGNNSNNWVDPLGLYDSKREAGIVAARAASQETATNCGTNVGLASSGGTNVAGSIWTPGPSGSPVNNAFEHWLKHGSEFPEYNNAKEYVEGARDFLKNPPKGSNAKLRPNGDIMIYDPKTNTFGAKDMNGTPRTMFRPTAGAPYFLKQVGKIIPFMIILLSPTPVE